MPVLSGSVRLILMAKLEGKNMRHPSDPKYLTSVQKSAYHALKKSSERGAIYLIMRSITAQALIDRGLAIQYSITPKPANGKAIRWLPNNEYEKYLRRE